MKRKEQKKKDREKRVAQKKIAAQKKAHEQKAAESSSTGSTSSKVFGVDARKKKEFLPTSSAANKPSHSHRRSGGG